MLLPDITITRTCDSRVTQITQKLRRASATETNFSTLFSGLNRSTFRAELFAANEIEID